MANYESVFTGDEIDEGIAAAERIPRPIHLTVLSQRGGLVRDEVIRVALEGLAPGEVLSDYEIRLFRNGVFSRHKRNTAGEIVSKFPVRGWVNPTHGKTWAGTEVVGTRHAFPDCAGIRSRFSVGALTGGEIRPVGFPLEAPATWRCLFAGCFSTHVSVKFPRILNFAFGRYRRKIEFKHTVGVNGVWSSSFAIRKRVGLALVHNTRGTVSNIAEVSLGFWAAPANAEHTEFILRVNQI